MSIISDRMSDLETGPQRRRSEKVTAAELNLLKLLWLRGELTIGELTAQVYAESSAPLYATVQKLLERLESKGFVVRDRSARAHLFRAVVERREFLADELQSLAEDLCEGSMTPLLTTMVQAADLKEEEIESLRKMVDQIEQKIRRKKT